MAEEQTGSGFSPQWDRVYRANAHLSVWPWSDLVTLVMRYSRPTGNGMRVLELGVGAGANVPFFMSLGCDYFGIDGSPTIVAQLRERFADIADHFATADFTRELPVPGDFDLVVDRASITHNNEQDIRRCLSLVHAKLKPGGVFIGVDWFSAHHREYAYGREAEDRHTRTDLSEGHLAGIGRIHFSDGPHLQSLFEAFEVVLLEHKALERVIPPSPGALGWYHIVCRKRLA
jgi:SAM-dependent methyltransferase